jgi:long-chain acyl-CoA synthetase
MPTFEGLFIDQIQEEMAEAGYTHTIPFMFSETVRRFGKRNAMAFVGENPLTYDAVNEKMLSLMAFLEKNGIVEGDKVSILSTNMPNWGITYFAIASMGAVVVPILPDFTPSEVSNVITHSEAKLVFVSSSLIQKLEGINAPELRIKILIDDFTLIGNSQEQVFIDGTRPVKQYSVSETDILSIIYTSGTTGKSKGVMLSHKNIIFNAIRGGMVHRMDENDRFLSVLPLSHTYENTLGLILPVYNGSCIYYLRKPPTPAVLLPALEEVRPTTMLTVPLIIEKIYFNKILPAFREKLIVKLLYKLPPFRKLLNRVAGKKLMKTFGGEIRFFGVGGAKLNKTVEKFLREAKFPYAIGYGLTETSPLLAGAGPKETVYESTGPKIKDIELIVHNPDKVTGEGEIWAKGPSIMLGYYKEPEMTREVLTADGWFKTGDLGVFDKNNNLYIRGRLKNMILGASGENIYPEEIESVINNFRHVVESLVIEKKGKLVALVHINMEELEKKYQHLKEEAHKLDERVEEMMKELKEYVNSRVNKFSQINKFEHQPDPFQKTATQKIKRFLYK